MRCEKRGRRDRASSDWSSRSYMRRPYEKMNQERRTQVIERPTKASCGAKDMREKDV